MRSEERGRTTGAAALALALLLAVGVWLVSGRDPGTPTTAPDRSTSTPGAQRTHSASPRPSAAPTRPPATDPASGLPYVAAADLPPEARDVLRRIDAGGPFAYEEDGGTFGNFEGLLPDHDGGYYAEYTVDTPGSEDRGARRIVAGDGGELYWTSDHYASFSRIRR